jgi:hypothetical protein
MVINKELMELKKTLNGFDFIEVDCQYKDVNDIFPCDGLTSIIRVFYKEGIPLRFDSIKIGDKEFDDKIDYGTLDYNYLIMGMVDVFKKIEFKKGDDFILKQFSTPNSELTDGTKLVFDNYRNSVEKIQIFLEAKIK